MIQCNEKQETKIKKYVLMLILLIMVMASLKLKLIEAFHCQDLKLFDIVQDGDKYHYYYHYYNYLNENENENKW